LAEDRQTLYGVDYKGRLLPLQESDNKYDLPLLTGLKTCPLYQKIPDYRLIQVMNQLERIRQEAPEFYLSLSTIDFTFGDSIMVRAEGLPCGIVMYAGGLYEGMMELKQFLLGFNPDLKMVTKLDFRSKGLIIATKKEVKPSVKAKAPDREKKKNVRSKNNNRH